MPAARAATSPLPPGESVAGDPCPLPPNAGPTSQAVAALDGAIASAFPNFGPLLKDGVNTYTKSTYITPETLLNDVRLPLIAQGVLISSSLELVKGGFVVTTTLSHSGGGWRSSSFPIANPGDATKVSASATKGQRINLLMLLAIVGRDDDGQEDPQPPGQQQAPGQWNGAPGAPLPTPQSGAYPPPQAQPPATPGAWPAPGQPVQAPPAQYPQQQAPAPQQAPPGQWQPPAAPQSAPPQPYV